MSDCSGLQTSLWAATAPQAPATEKLVEHMKTDVLIVGGGFTGCSTALHLARKNVEVILLESAEIGFGGSGRNIGLVNAGLWLDPEVVLRRLPAPYGERILAGLGAAPALVKEIADRHGISCSPGGRGVMKMAHSPAASKAVAGLVRQWRDRGAPVEFVPKQQLDEALGTRRSCGGLADHRTFTIQPLGYARGLAAAAQAAGARIHTESRVSSLTQSEARWTATTAEGSVSAERVVVCTGAYSTDLIPGLASAFTPAGCFALATRPLPKRLRSQILPDGAAFFDSRPAMHFARYDDTHRLIIGTLGWLPPHKAAVGWGLKVLGHYFPQLSDVAFDFAWTGNIDFTDDHIPWISRPAPGLHAIGGFNGRGIGPGTFWGAVLAEWLTGLPDEDLPLPVRPIRPIPFNRAKKAFYSSTFWTARTQMRHLG